MLSKIFAFTLVAIATAQSTPAAKILLNWVPLSKVTLSQVDVNSDGSLWGVTADSKIYYCSDFRNCTLAQAPGALSQISSVITSGNSGIVCARNSAEAIFCATFDGKSANVTWTQVPGALIVASINADGSLWGTNRANEIWFCADYKNCGWVKVPGGLKQVSSFSRDKGTGVVCGTASGDTIFCSEFKNEAVSWVQIPGGLKQVKVVEDGSLFGVNSGNGNFYCSNYKSCNWVAISNTLNQIDAVAGTVCGTTTTNTVNCSRVTADVPLDSSINLIENGSFEKAAADFCKKDWCLVSDPAGIAPWKATAPNNQYEVDGMWPTIDGGKWTMDLSSTGPVTLEQTVKLVPGNPYRFTLWLNGNPCVESVKEISIEISGTDAITNRYKFTKTGAGFAASDWTPIVIPFTALSENANVKITSLTASGCGPVVDNISIIGPKKCKTEL